MKKNSRIKKENAFLKKFKKPSAVQDFLDSIPFNFETHGETCMSPVRTFKEKKAHCLEGALFAAACFFLQGETPYIMNLKVRHGFGDDDHAVALYKRNGYWGAISKTNHAVLRFRDPVYKTPRELAMSYFHEYFLGKDGTKTMSGYSKPINMRRFGSDWIFADEDLWEIAEIIFNAKHFSTVPKKNVRYIRKATLFERKVTDTPEYKK
ncbi:MAG: hypothetical protein QG653_85 [Patescibacteria group bacterium]|nr:hypothetical protein [Patescibacteria group bacterium]